VVFLGPWLLEFFHKRGIRSAEAITDEHCVEAFADLVHDRHGKVPDPEIPHCATWALLAEHVAGTMHRLKTVLVRLFRAEWKRQRKAAKRRRAAKVGSDAVICLRIDLPYEESYEELTQLFFRFLGSATTQT
jgi:hypothetical protein